MPEEAIVVAAVEGGGTSFVVAVAQLAHDGSTPKILQRTEVDSSHDEPQKTLNECSAFLAKHKPEGGYHALGVATFGPVGLDPFRKEAYGRILGTTPKKPWRNVDFLTPLTDACQGSRSLKVKIETDVNAPAFAEYLLAKNELSSVAYITVGTGVGVGLVIHGQPVHGRMHPEGGHIPVHPLDGDNFQGYSWGGSAPFKGHRTVEGLTSSVALIERLEQITGTTNLPRGRLAELEDNHEVWDHSANALANLCVTLILTTSVEKIVIGGGIMNRNGLIQKVRLHSVALLNGYLELPNDMTELICKSSYGTDVGLIGAMVLAQYAHEGDQKAARQSSDTTAAFNGGLVYGVVLGAGLAIATLLVCRPTK